jgi:hypothetical protein
MLSVESEDEGESCERAILLRSGFGIIAGQQAETIIWFRSHSKSHTIQQSPSTPTSKAQADACQQIFVSRLLSIFQNAAPPSLKISCIDLIFETPDNSIIQSMSVGQQRNSLHFSMTNSSETSGFNRRNTQFRWLQKSFYWKREMAC